MTTASAPNRVCSMQLIQIGETHQKTVLELVQEMAARQLAEIEQLKQAAQSRVDAREPRRMRCGSPKRAA
jgi:hypothetical protein